MPRSTAADLASFLQDRVGDNLRSVAHYDADSYDVVYLRDDVADQYSETDHDRVSREARLESVDREHQEDLYVHGRLECTVRAFENAVEMHFPVDDASGVTVALDAEALTAHRTFVGRCLEIASGE